MSSNVNGKTGILTPCRSETPENFITKIGHFDYVVGATGTPNFMGIGPWVTDRQTDGETELLYQYSALHS